MSAQAALPVNDYLHAPVPVARRQRPFLEALEHAEYGQLVLITPEGHVREFAGRKPGPMAHLKVYDWRAVDALLERGETGFAEAYMHYQWSSKNLPDLITFALLNHDALEKFFYGKPWHAFLTYLRRILHTNSLTGSRRNIMAHYDLGNDFYALWLDKSMTYSCALFEGDNKRTLEEAQIAKYRRILSRLNARPGDHILEIGCGWGGFAETAAAMGARVTAITLSEEQAEYAKKRLRRAGLEYLVSVELSDYRSIAGQFDHIVSIGMFEHVGERCWPAYFDTIKKHLKPGGKAMVQSITLDDVLFEKFHRETGFIEEVIFPGGMLPSKRRFCAAAQKAGLECRDLYAFGKDYARTAQIWLDRFHASRDKVKALGYDEPFVRVWRFYLSACIAAFASGRTDVMQAELTHAE